MPVYITIALALVPSLLLVRYFQLHDAYPEPSRQIWRTFFLGALTIVPVLLLTYPMFKIVPIPENPFARGVVISFLFAAIPEELFKLLVLTRFSMRHRTFDEPMDGIVYGAVVGQGFAALENVLYSVSGGAGLAISRAFTAVPAHAVMGVIMGHYIGRARFETENRGKLIFTGFACAMLVHGLYDTPLIAIQGFLDPTGEVPSYAEDTVLSLILATLIILVVSLIWASLLHRSARRAQRDRTVPPPIPYPPDLPSPASRARMSVYGAVTVVWGLVLAVAGGAMSTGGVRAILAANTDQSVLLVMIAATLFLGFVPLVSGIVVFGVGVRRLSAAYRASLGTTE